MIITEQFKVGERDFVRTYSDKGMMIHGGSPEWDYSEACDPAELGRTYTETDIPIDGEYSGHANKEDLKMDLRMMMDNSKSDQERMAIQKVLDMWKE